MGFWRDIADELGQDDVLSGLDQAQSEAIIDTLTLALYADDEATFLELNELEHLLHELPWALTDTSAVDDYTEKSAEIAQALSTRKEFRDRAREIAGRLTELDVRKKALRMAAQLVYADWDASDEEHTVLLDLAECFEIPKPFALAMIQDVGDDSTSISLSSHAPLHEEPEPELQFKGADLPVEIPRPTNVQAALSREFLQKFFDGLFADESVHQLTREQSLAFVDALTLALVADGLPDQSEIDQFKVYLKGLPFTTVDADAVYTRMEAAIKSLRDSHSDAETLDALIKDIAAELTDPALRAKALRMAVMITHADLLITGEEENVLFSIAEGFAIPIEELEAVIVEVKASAEGA